MLLATTKILTVDRQRRRGRFAGVDVFDNLDDPRSRHWRRGLVGICKVIAFGF